MVTDPSAFFGGALLVGIALAALFLIETRKVTRREPRWENPLDTRGRSFK